MHPSKRVSVDIQEDGFSANTEDFGHEASTLSRSVEVDYSIIEGNREGKFVADKTVEPIL